jgi:hypothetical protein
MRITTAIPLLALAATFYQAPAARPPRDAAARSDSGRSSLIGRVVLVMDGRPLPIRRAHVALESEVLNSPADTDTDIEGRYRFDALPAGHYRVVVEKPGFVARDGGAGVSERAPTIDLQRDASAVLDVVMQRGAAVEGRMVNASGEPAANVTVMAFAFRDGLEQRGAAARDTKTDDLGRYRLHTLQAGEYVIDTASDPLNVPDRQRITVAAGQELRGLDFTVPTDASAAGNAPDAGVFVGVSPPAGTFILAARQKDSRQMPRGTARISGRVTSAATARPIGNVTMRLLCFEEAIGDVLNARTDSQGLFEFVALPPCAYQLTATADGHVTLAYGQRRPAERGRPITLADGQRFENADIALPRTSAVEGRVLDELGDPAAGVIVQIARVDYVAGRSRLVPIASRTPARPTDDLGQFRISGLPPGDYFVAALSGPFAGHDDRAGFATTFYPGATTPANAQPVHVDVAQDVTNLTFQLTPAADATISGTAVDAAGQLAAGVQVLLVQTQSGDVRAGFPARGSAIGGDGSFTFRHVPLGTYVLQAMSQTSFGSLPISVEAPAMTDLQLKVSPGATLRGRFVFEGDAPPPLTGLDRVAPVPTDFVLGPFIGRGLPPGSVNTDWTFETSGVFGVGVLRAAGLPRSWILKRTTLNGRDVTDTPLDFRTGDLDGFELTMTSHSASLSGTVVDGRTPVTDYAVIVFASDSTKWTFPSRFVTIATPDQRGSFVVSGLLPETYLAIAVPEVQGAQWQDPAFLETLRPVATRVTVAEGETRTQELKLFRR